MNLQVGLLQLYSSALNNTARKEKLVEIFAKALPHFADFVLIEDDAKQYGRHDLVGDMLLSHHNTIVRHLDNNPHPQFIEIKEDRAEATHRHLSMQHTMVHDKHILPIQSCHHFLRHLP